MDSTSQLNSEQKIAIEHSQGPLLIIAGAGTGKTTVITEKIKFLITEKKIAPEKILALTFTEKASFEMQERIDQSLPYGYSQLWISTYHSFCDRILRKEALHIGLSPSYTLHSQAQSILFLKKHFFSFALDYFRPLGNPYKFLEALLQHFSRLSDEDISPTEYLTWAQNQTNPLSKEEELEQKKNKELAHAYVHYEQLKRQENVMDFSDLISNTLLLFRNRKNILSHYQSQFEFILVDEFQDTNYAQNQLALLLADSHHNITVVGDDDQAIYRWRGAAVSNMIQFRSHFPTVTIVTLTKNYRSTEHILNTSYQMITHNNPDRLEVKEQIDKRLVSMRKKKGNPITLILADTGENEAEKVAKTISDLILSHKYTFKDIALLVRANDHANSFITTFQRHQIPYQFLGPGKLFQKEEIRDFIAYLKFLANPNDSASLYRILTNPIFSFNLRDIAQLFAASKRKNLSLFEILEHIHKTHQIDFLLQESTKEKIGDFITMVHTHLDKVPHHTAGHILYDFMQKTGMIAQILSAATVEDMQKAQHITRFFEKLMTFETQSEHASIFSVSEWIDLSLTTGESPLISEIENNEENAVQILTIHSSKGLEFPVVFLVNLVTQRFPTRERAELLPVPSELIKEILPEGEFHLQEERRLFYVGMTRAKDQLFFSAASFYSDGKRERVLSPFIGEALGKEAIEHALTKQHEEKKIIQPSLLEWNPPIKSSDQTPIQNTPLTITYLSYSQLQCFDICPLHYKLKYILKVPTEPSASLSYGTSIHAVLRDYYSTLISEKKIPVNTIEDSLKKNWNPLGYNSKEHEREAFQKAQIVLQHYVKKNVTLFTTQKPQAVEVPFQFFLSNLHKKVKLAGRIDRIDLRADGKIEIIDYKTGLNVPTQKDIEKDLQLTFYALAATEVNEPLLHKQPEEILLTLSYLEADITLSTTRTKEQLLQAKEHIFKKIQEIETSDFKCNKSMLCTNCEFKLLCHTGK